MQDSVLQQIMIVSYLEGVNKLEVPVRLILSLKRKTRGLCAGMPTTSIRTSLLFIIQLVELAFPVYTVYIYST
jgi:hypothetical protein